MSTSKAWSYLIIGGLLEIVWASGLKFDEIPIFVVIIAILISFDFLISFKVLPIGTAYAVFTSMGTLGTLIVDFIFGESSMSFWKFLVILPPTWLCHWLKSYQRRGGEIDGVDLLDHCRVNGSRRCYRC